MDPQAGPALADPARAATAGGALSGPQSWLQRFQSLSPIVRVSLVLVILSIVGGLAWVSQSGAADREQRILFSNISSTDGAAIIESLEQMNVPYQVTEGGSAITVPKSLVYETRLKLAGQGLPKSGNVGFEILEKQKFGTSQFVERVNYLRGLEGELARSISSMAQVKAARVHLAVPKQTSFTREQERPSASVLVTLHPGRMLDPSQTAAIARLVSASVPGLQAQDVALLDTDGGSLTTTQARGDLDANQLKYTKEVEASLARRLADLLTPLAGPDGFRAQVTVDLSFDEREKTSEVYSRNAGDQSIRSEQTLESQSQAGGPGGLPGALSNQPPTPPEAPIVNQVNGRTPASTPGNAQAARELTAPGRVETGQSVSESGQIRREKVINYEVDRSIERFKPSRGQIRRVSAAVVLDYKPGTGSARTPYSQEELRQINTLVRDAIGYVQARGDTVSVANLPFNAPPPNDPVPAVSESPWAVDLWGQAKTAGLVLLGALLLYLLVIRPLLRPRPVVAPAAPEPVFAAMTDREKMQREIEEKEEAWARQREVWAAEERLREQDEKLRKDKEEQLQAERKRQLDELLDYANNFASQNPEQAALLLKSWASSKPVVGAPRPAPASAQTPKGAGQVT